MTVCYLAIGSNLGDRQHTMERALKMIRGLPMTRLLKVSSFMETDPEGGPPGQCRYLNACAQIDTQLSPHELLLELGKIEVQLGRVRVGLNGPRTIDLDILLYGDVRIDEDALSIPHPRMLQRIFVVIPLRQIAPEALMTARRLLRKKTSGTAPKKPAVKARKKKRN